MKKYFIRAIICSVIVMNSSCESKQKEIELFSQDFAEKVQENQIDSLISVYPALENIDSISIPGYNPENIQVKKDKGDLFLVSLSPQVSLNIKFEGGRPLVVDSYGLFVYPKNIYEISKSLNLVNNGQSDMANYAVIKEKVLPYVNFSTPDLSFLNVKGHVKTIQWSNTPNYEFCSTPWQNFWGWGGNYEFNEAGEWINFKKFRMSPYASIVSLNRNLEEQINKIFYPGDYGYDEDINYSWEDNVLKSFSALGSRGEFIYENDLLTKIEYQFSNTEFMVSANIVISDFQFDEIGNWVACKFVKTVKERNKRISGDIIRKIEYYPLQ